MPVLLPTTSIDVPVANGESVGAYTWDGAWASVVCSGTFDGGTVTLQCSYDAGVTWLTVVDSLDDPVTFAADGYVQQVVLGGNPLLRASLAGSSGATAVILKLAYGAALFF